MGQMKPLLKTSSASPRTLTMRSPSSVSSSPQVASQRGHVRMAVVVSAGMGGCYSPVSSTTDGFADRQRRSGP